MSWAKTSTFSLKAYTFLELQKAYVLVKTLQGLKSKIILIWLILKNIKV